MNQLTEPPAATPEPSPANTSAPRAPYVAPQLEVHESWVLTTGVSFAHESFLAQLPGRSS